MLEIVLKSYIETALWSSMDENGNPLDATYSNDDLHQSAVDAAREDVATFIKNSEKENPNIFERLPYSQIGHDFWLTRAGHGAGFWDGDYEKAVGDLLTKVSKSFGECTLYIGDDGKLYFS